MLPCFVAGGHPHNWNAISKECLSLLTELTQRLVAHHDAVASNGRAKSQSTSSSTDTKSGSWSSGMEFCKCHVGCVWHAQLMWLVSGKVFGENNVFPSSHCGKLLF